MERSLEVVGVSYRYPRADADVLHDVDASFPRGSFTVVMGRAGSGKSTLLMTLNGVIPQLKEGTLTGRVLLDGADLAGFRVQTITRYVGLVLQDPESQLLGRTVAEDVAFGPRSHLVPREQIRQRVGVCLETVALGGFEDRETARLSGGQKQRLAIAGVLALQPQVLCLDEPTSELDPQGRAELYTTVDALRGSGEVTVIAAEHASSDVVHRADQLLVLVDGQVGWQGRPADFFRDPDLAVRHLVKPLPVAVLGTELVAAGLIGREQVPLAVAEAEALVRRLAGRRLLPPPVAPATSRPLSAPGARAVAGRAQRGPADRAVGQGAPPPGVPSASTDPGHPTLGALPTGDPVIELRNLVHTYPGGRRGLAGVDLTVNRGDYVALVGRNGAGKSTLAKHLNRILDPTSGTVIIDGVDAGRLQPWELARQVGYVFQNPDHQIFNTSVAGEVRYGLRLAGLPPSEVEQRIAEVLALTGLDAVRDEHPFSLGKGERQRIAVASILALRPGILVVDEPTTGQDWAGIQTMMGLIDRLNAEGTTIVMVTHDIDVVAHHARRVVVMNDGQVLADGPTAEVLARTDLLAEAAVATTQTVELCRRLWPGSPVLLEEAALGRYLAKTLAGGVR